MTTAYPLTWPTGWPRTPAAGREPSGFNQKKDTGRGWQQTVNVTVATARDEGRRANG